jgi:hypothetical protein
MEKEVKDLQEQLGAAQLREAALKEAIDEKDGLIEELESKVKTPSVSLPTKPIVPEETTTIDGNEYALVVAAFWHEGKFYLSSEAIKNTELMTELVETESGIIKSV